MQLKRITICVALAFAPGAFAAEATDAALPDVEVIGKKVQPLPALSDSALGGTSIVRLRASTSDTAKLLDGQPGVSLSGAGGVSSLPVIHGMADDRVRVKVDGMDLISACANHMNPPLSYIDPSNVGSIQVFAGITPVSVGGDSIGGTIQVSSAAPEFAADDKTLLKGQAGAFYRSNGNAQGGNLSATIAGERLSMTYSGSTTKSDDYTAAHDFKQAKAAATNNPANWLAGDVVGSSMYKSTNHALGFALRHENHLVELKLGLQNIPYQGFPNQHMDMTGNDSKQINLRYAGQYQWGALEARVYDEKTRHVMDFAGDKQFYFGTLSAAGPCSPIRFAGDPAGTCAAGMPMDTEGKTTGALAKADILLSERDILRVGGEYQRYRLNDWWTPSGGGMGPNTFWNINNGERDRLDAFGEWEARWSPQWIIQIGVRSGTVKMNTGTVQGYNTSATYLTDANNFNASNRGRTDHNWDLTALGRYTPDDSKAFEFGYAQKTRSPNLYERYSWSTGAMAMAMVNLVNDGNGYVGNLSLKPEVAHTFSATADWHDAAEEQWGLKITPYYTHVQDYIDARRCNTTDSVNANCNGTNQLPAKTTGFVHLKFVNQSARLYGADVSGYFPLAKTGDYGSFTAKGALNYVNGKNQTTGDNLYNIMPLNAKLTVVQNWGNWTNTLEGLLVDAKRKVSQVRDEVRTGGYGLLNLRSSYDWKQVRFDVGVENILNKFYNPALGGAYIGQGATMTLAQTAAYYGTLVPGMGRSLYAGATLKF